MTGQTRLWLWPSKLCSYEWVFQRSPFSVWRGVRQRFIFQFIPQKIRTSEFVYPKKSLLFFRLPKKIPRCFCISKFYYSFSGKLKHAKLNSGFSGQKQKARMTVRVSLHPIFCDNFTRRYSLWHLQHVLSLAHSLLAMVPKHPYPCLLCFHCGLNDWLERPWITWPIDYFSLD